MGFEVWCVGFGVEGFGLRVQGAYPPGEKEKARTRVSFRTMSSFACQSVLSRQSEARATGSG